MDAPIRFPTAETQPPRLRLWRLSRVQRTQLDAAIAHAVAEHGVELLQAPAGFSRPARWQSS